MIRLIKDFANFNSFFFKNYSDFILGLTILAFGNSIGGILLSIRLSNYQIIINNFVKIFNLDLMSNISMARNGFARMGISVSYR